MLVSNRTKSMLSIPLSLRTIGLVTGTIGVLGVFLSTLSYAIVEPGFDLLYTSCRLLAAVAGLQTI